MRIIYLSILLLVIQTSLAQQSLIKRLDGSQIKVNELEAGITQLMDAAQVQGMGVSIFNANRTVYQKAFGYKNLESREVLRAQTNMYGASLSKAVFAVLVMRLVEEGVLELDVPLQSYLDKKIYAYEPQTRWHDDYSDLKTDSLYQKITARMCLNHTSGFPNWRWFEPDRKLRVKFEPGSRYSYSGEGMTYLQVVLEKLTGKPLEDLAREYTFAPLGMHNSSFVWQTAYAQDFAYGHARTGALYPKDIDNEARAASTLETTLADFSLFLEAMLQKKLLKPESYGALFSPSIRIRSIRQFGPLSQKVSTLNDAIQLAYGLGWGLIQTPYGPGAIKGGHGEGFQHYSILFPEAGTGILLMTNSDNGESIFKELLALSIADTFSPTDWNNYIPYQQLGPIPESWYGYQCVPCKQACDARTVKLSGDCSDCGMRLLPKIALQEVN